MIKPSRLHHGDTICVVSPSSEISNFPRRTARGIHELEKMGFKTVFSTNARNICGRDAGSPEERAADIMNAFEDKSVNALIASTGGYTANSILEYLDYDIIAKNPKIFIGFSDITALLLAITYKTGLVTFHGPSLLPSFGAPDGLHEATRMSLEKVILNFDPKLALPGNLGVFSEDNKIWDQDDDHPRVFKPDEGARCINKGSVEGHLLGGNLDTLLGIIGTEYCPELRGAILLLEEAGGVASKSFRSLKILEHHGILSRIAGLAFGRTYCYQDNNPPHSLDDRLKAIGQKYNIPVISNLPFGHTEPKLTIPLGVNARLDADNKLITLLEPCTI